MKLQVLFAAIISIALATSAWADTNIVNESFDSYANQAAFETAWTGTNIGLLVPGTGTPPNDDPPGIQGQAVNILTGINEWSTPFSIIPSATQAVRVSGDLFDDIVGNKKVSIGLRSSSPANIIELGMYNADAIDPLDGSTVIPATDFAYRVVLFDPATYGGGLTQSPDWQYFPLDPVLDVTDAAQSGTPDGKVNVSDIGVGWHSYSATITETTVTLELDLYRDGLVNTEPTAGVGTVAGPDSSVTWQLGPHLTSPFDSLRIGSPSGIPNSYEAVVDNISLDMIDVAASDNADFNGDLVVDGNDFLIWQRGSGLSGQTDNSNGDADGDGLVNAADLAVWDGQFGGAAPAAGAAAAIPEPTTATLSLLALAGVAALARRRK